MEEKEINYIELINEKIKQYPDSKRTPVDAFMAEVINILNILEGIPKEKINKLGKALYENMCEHNFKWKYGDKEPGDVLVEEFLKIFEGSEENGK